MNPTAQSETEPTGKWGRLAWLPILLLLAAIFAARVAGLSESYESHALLLVLSFTFYTLVSLGTLYLIGRSFLASGSPGLLLLECGVVLWSLAGTVGDFVSHGDANINVTIFNIGILLSGLCHLAGAILALSPQQVLRMRSVWLATGCAFALGALWLISQAALAGWLPVFFIPGQGGTLVRHAVLISAIAMFALSAGVLHANQRAARLPFTSWYKLALLTLAVGLFGIMIQLSLGSVVNWLSRGAQWLGGLYLLFAAIASLRESHLPLFPLEKKPHPAYYRDAVAVAVVLTAAAIRLAFLSVMGTHSPYVVFFPAVMFAAIYGGLRPGLLATAVSAILTDYFWIMPVNQFKVGQLSDQLSIIIFLLSGGMVSWVSDSMHRARARASAAETQALLAAEFRRQNKIQEAINRIFEKTLTCDTEEELGRMCLSVVEELTGSKFSFVGEIGEDGYLHDIAISDPGWELCTMYDKTGHRRPPGDFKIHGLYGRVLLDGRSLFVNDPASHPDSIGTPEGHPQLTAFLGVPFIQKEKAIGMVAVGNRDGGYAQEQQQDLEAVVSAIFQALFRKRAEEALRQSEQRWATTLESIGDGVIATDVDGKVTFMNAVSEGLTGWQLREALQKPVTQVLHVINEHTRKEVDNPVSKVLQEGKVIGLANHTVLIRKDGAEVAIDDSGAPIKDERGNTLGVVLVFRDITERKRSEEQLRESEEKFRLLIKYAPSMIYEIDFHRPAFKSVNDVMCQFLGYTREELLAMSPFDLLNDEGKALFRERIRRQLVGETVSDSVEYKSRTKDGREVYGVLNMTFTYKDGKPEGAVVVAHDITERKRTEEALRNAHDQLEKRVQERTSQLSEAVGRLRSENIHRKQLEDTLRESEIQVRFFASQCLTAQETERKRVAGELHDSIAAALAAMKFRIEKIAEDMKQGNGRPESMQDLGSMVFEINNEVRRIMADLRPSILDDLGIVAAMNWFCREYQKTYSNISVENQVDLLEREVPDSLKTPIFRISQEAMNNISKYSKASLVHLSLRKEDDKILLTIQDNGQGFHLDTVRKGMGLSTMRERAQLSGGSFELGSEMGKGTIVRVSWTI